MIDKESGHIEGPRITLYECTRDLCILLMQEDSKIEKKLGLRVPDKWNSFGREMFAYSLGHLESYSGSGLKNPARCGSVGVSSKTLNN